jgi:hypothetical protein
MKAQKDRRRSLPSPDEQRRYSDDDDEQRYRRKEPAWEKSFIHLSFFCFVRII